MGKSLGLRSFVWQGGSHRQGDHRQIDDQFGPKNNGTMGIGEGVGHGQGEMGGGTIAQGRGWTGWIFREKFWKLNFGFFLLFSFFSIFRNYGRPTSAWRWICGLGSICRENWRVRGRHWRKRRRNYGRRNRWRTSDGWAEGEGAAGWRSWATSTAGPSRPSGSGASWRWGGKNQEKCMKTNLKKLGTKPGP